MPKSSSEMRDALLAQLVERVARPLRVAHQRGLGDLDLEPLRRQAGDLQRIADVVDHVALVKLQRRQVDGHAHLLGPLHALHAGLAQRPASEIDDQAHLLGDRNDVRRRHHAARRMTPAQQRLAGRDPSGLQVHQRLEVQLELLVDERLAQVDFQRTARLDDLRHLLAEEAERAAPVRLRPVEGEVGVLEQIVGSHRSRCDGDADAGADLDQMVLDLVALAQPLDDPPREVGGIFAATRCCAGTRRIRRRRNGRHSRWRRGSPADDRPPRRAGGRRTGGRACR